LLLGNEDKRLAAHARDREHWHRQPRSRRPGDARP
jgi:hypothetical protein